MTKNLGGPAEGVLGQTLDELELSALQGCQLCWLRFNQITDEEKATLSRTQNIKYGCWESEIGDGTAFEYERLGEEEPLTHSISLVPEQQVSLAAPITTLRRMEQNEHFANADPVHNVWSSNNSVASFTTASMWIRGCLQNHETCNQTSPTGRHLPTHLIDLSTDKCVRPRLCYGRDLPVEASYMTLSHC